MIEAIVRERVLRRAGERCEYCRIHRGDHPFTRLHIEHIVPRKHGGSDDEGNLAMACIRCNLHKGPNLTGIDPATGALTSLFHPRHDNWNEHFEWNGVRAVGRTATGRATIQVPAMNAPERLRLRLVLAEIAAKE